MKKYMVLLIATLIAIGQLNSQQQNNLQFPDIKENTFEEVTKKYNEYFEAVKEIKSNEENPLKGQGFKPFKRWEYFWSTRVDQNGQLPTRKELRNSYNEFKNNYLFSNLVNL